jgi:hypothetical protein
MFCEQSLSSGLNPLFQWYQKVGDEECDSELPFFLLAMDGD